MEATEILIFFTLSSYQVTFNSQLKTTAIPNHEFFSARSGSHESTLTSAGHEMFLSMYAKYSACRGSFLWLLFFLCLSLK